MFKANAPRDWQSEDRFFDKQTGRFYTLDDNGQLIPTQNRLTVDGANTELEQAIVASGYDWEAYDPS